MTKNKANNSQALATVTNKYKKHQKRKKPEATNYKTLSKLCTFSPGTNKQAHKQNTHTAKTHANVTRNKQNEQRGTKTKPTVEKR